MVASREMRAIRELSLAAPLVLAGAAIFFGGGPGNSSLMWLGGGALLIGLLLLATARGARRAARAAAPRRPRGLARAVDLVVAAARPLVGLRRPRPRLPPFRGARALARHADARACERSLHPARSSRGLVARGQGAAGRARLWTARARAAERSRGPVEPARRARRVRAAACALAAAPRRNAACLRLDRRASADVLARRDPDRCGRGRRVVRARRTSARRAPRRSWLQACRLVSSRRSRSYCPG